MPDDPRPPGERLIIIVGGDALALATAQEICELPGHRVNVLWEDDGEFAEAVARIGAAFVPGRPERRDALERGGVHEAAAILVLSRNDELNLQTALRARDANPGIRLVLRQFNRTLAAKIEQNLPDCSVLSLAWHSAATYAAVALDPSCFRGLQFPEPEGPLTGFALRQSDAAEIAGMSIAIAEKHLGARIVAVNGDTDCPPATQIPRNAQVVVFGPMEGLLTSSPRQSEAGQMPLRQRLRQAWRHGELRPHRLIDPILGSLIAAAIGLFVAGVVYFHYEFPLDWLLSAYFVLTTMTTSGYGDIVPSHDDPSEIIAAMVLMAAGISFVGIFIALISARLTRAQWVRMQGLRRVRRRGHIIVCGAGSIGSGVIDLLAGFDRPLVVVEAKPDPAMVERARDEGFDLLTGDASRDETLELCNLRAAHSLIALTNVDTLNLEIALGARARNPTMPIVLRIAEAGLAASIARHFDLETTFSVAALAAPAFAGLSRLPGGRGRIAFDGQEFGIAELILGENESHQLPAGAIPLAVGSEDGEFELTRDIADLEPGTRVLILATIAKLREDPETFRGMIEADEAARAAAG